MLKASQGKNEKLNKRELISGTFLCIVLFASKVIFSSVKECRKIRRRQENEMNEQDREPKATKTAIGRYGKSCSECCCKWVPKRCFGFRYLCRMLCCLLPICLCNEICCTRYCRPTGSSCELRCKKCSDDPIMKLYCRQYVVIVLRVLISEAIVVCLPIVVFDIFELYFEFPAIRNSALALVVFGVLLTFPIVLFLTCIHSCISNTLGRVFGCCCYHCCCCCYCCCSFKDSEHRQKDYKVHSV